MNRENAFGNYNQPTILKNSRNKAVQDKIENAKGLNKVKFE